MRNVIIAASDPGGYDAHYTSLNAAENGENGSLADHITIYGDTLTDTTATVFAGWTQNGFDVIVRGLTHLSYRLTVSSPSSAIYALSNQNASALSIKFQGVHLVKSGGSNFGFSVVLSPNLNTAGTTEIDGCFIHMAHTGVSNMFCVENDGAAGTVKARNSAFAGGTHSLFLALGTTHVHNCVVNGKSTAIGIDRSGGTVSVKNTAVFNCTNDFNGTITADYCASDDGDGTNAVDISPGGTEATDWAAAFTDYTNHDYTLKDDASVLFEAGTDLSGDANYAVTTDAFGTARTAPFDIGIEERSVGGGGGGSTQPPRSMHQFHMRRAA